MRKCFMEPSLRASTTSCSMTISQTPRPFVGDETSSRKLTRGASRMFPALGMVEIDIGSDVVREAVQFISSAAQHLLKGRLEGRFRQSPSVVGLCAIIG